MVVVPRNRVLVANVWLHNEKIVLVDSKNSIEPRI
jgi:hypothetical protein